MLSYEQVLNTWERVIESEVRALYFGDLANLYSRRKQFITGVSFFLSSGAAATVLAKAPSWVPVTLSVIVALATAYSIACNLDSTMRTMAKLSHSWSELAAGYERIWCDPYSEESATLYHQLGEKERELSMLATTDAPNDQERLRKWQIHVFRLRNLQES